MSVSDDPDMKSIIVSVATICTLLVGDGLEGSVSAHPVGVGIAPSVDVPAPDFAGINAGRGGQAARIVFDDATLSHAMSAWYRLAFVDGGTRLQVFEQYAASTTGPESDMQVSETIGWRLANAAVGPEDRSTETELVPPWARVRTGNNTGPSAGLIFTLAYIDLLTPGALVGNLRVAGTGGIAVDGFAYAVSGIDVKVATAMLTQPDVIFTTEPPTSSEHVTILESRSARVRTGADTIAGLLNLDGYERAGRSAATQPGTAVVVVVQDLRQALAWLCGRTGSTTACGIADRTANVAIGG